MSIIYYLIDTTKSQSNGFISSMENAHKAGSNQASLSVAYNVAGDRALVKVNGDQSIIDRPDPQDVILAEYAKENHDQVFSFFYTAEWQHPDENL